MLVRKKRGVSQVTLIATTAIRFTIKWIETDF